MATMDGVLARLDLVAAVEKELSTANRLMPSRPDRLALMPSAQHVAKWLSGQYARGRFGAPASVLLVDKNRRGTRPMSELSLSDRVLYRALVNLISQTLPEWLVTRMPIAEFRESPLSSSGVRYISKADVASYYEFIDHDMLHDELLSQTGESAAIGALTHLLERVMGRRVGLPQIHKASDILGDAYIDPVRRQLRRSGFEAYTFSDDFLIASPSLAAARNALEACATAVRGRGLVLNESKTFTYGVRKYRTSLSEFATAERKLFEVEGLELLRSDDYADADTQEVPPGVTEPGEPTLAGQAEDDVIEDVSNAQSVGETPQVEAHQEAAAMRAWEMWMSEDESDETQSGQAAAITQSLLGRALPILGAAGHHELLEGLSLVLRYEPSLTPQVVKYLASLAGTSPAARAKIRVQLDALMREDNFSLWQRMWLADAAGSVRRGKGDHSHYDWLAECVSSAPAPLAATAAAAMGRLGLGKLDLLAGALDRVGPAWRSLVFWGLAQMDASAADGNAEDQIERLMVKAVEA